MPQFNVHQAKTNLSQLLERADAGEEIVIARAGKPVARLVKWEPDRAPRKLGLFTGSIQVAPDFDELPPDMAEAFEGSNT